MLGIAAGGTYALIADARRGSFFVDDPAEVDRNMKRRIGLGSSIGLGLALAALVPRDASFGLLNARHARRSRTQSAH